MNASEIVEAAELLKAIRGGELDGFVVSECGVEEVQLLSKADTAYRLLIDNIGQGAVTITSDGTLLYANRRFAAMVHMPPAALSGRPLEKFIAEKDRPRFAALLAAKGSREKSVELGLVSDDGAVVPVHISAEITLGDSGTCLIVTDLTEAKQHEALLMVEASGRAVLEQAIDAIVMCDIRGIVVRASRSAVALSAVNPLNQSFASAFHLQAYDIRPDLGRVRLGHVIKRQRCSLLRPSGESLDLLLSAGPVIGAAGEVLGCVITMTDVTELARAEAELRKADQSKDDFLAVLAHELRNPLAPIRTTLEDIDGDLELKPRVQTAHALISRQIGNLTRLVDDLVDVTRIRLGKIKIECGLSDLRYIAMQAVEASRPLIDDRRHHFTISMPEEALPVMADSLRLCQVILNLLNNAAKFTPVGGNITLTLRHDEVARAATVIIEDSGRGISAEMLPRIFDPFVQAPQSPELSINGLGVGLYLARQIVEMHGGVIEAFSNGLGHGSSFRVSLALTDQATGESSQAKPIDSPVAATRRRLLIVDDNRDAADSLGLLLEKLGHEVHIAYEGISAVQSAMHCSPDVVLLDLGLPDISGHEVCRQLRGLAQLHHTKIVALTGFGSSVDIVKTTASGFDRHLVKPASLVAIAQILNPNE